MKRAPDRRAVALTYVLPPEIEARFSDLFRAEAQSASVAPSGSAPA